MFLHVSEAGLTAALISSIRYQRYWRPVVENKGKCKPQ